VLCAKYFVLCARFHVEHKISKIKISKKYWGPVSFNWISIWASRSPIASYGGGGLALGRERCVVSTSYAGPAAG